jgi:phosphoribosyl 1,2-cyclic phosphodiesterase
MPLRFTVLASGSGGNASLLETDGFALLLDAGLGPRQLASRLATVKASWRQVQAVLLTHTHSDHWNERTLTYLHRLKIPLYCHDEHHESLRSYSPGFAALQAGNLVRGYEPECELQLAPSLRCRPFPLRHDGGATFGFRLEGADDLFGQPCAVAYAADLGSWTAELAQALADVDVLALEFNHDVELEFASGRSPRLIQRVVGDAGHLSNVQAAALLREVLRLSPPGRLQHVVQLHLSRDCNRPGLAQQTAAAVLADSPTAPEVHTACQDVPLGTLVIGAAAPNGRRAQPSADRRAARSRKSPLNTPCWLPGLEPT